VIVNAPFVNEARHYGTVFAGTPSANEALSNRCALTEPPAAIAAGATDPPSDYPQAAVTKLAGNVTPAASALAAFSAVAAMAAVTTTSGVAATMTAAVSDKDEGALASDGG